MKVKLKPNFISIFLVIFLMLFMLGILSFLHFLLFSKFNDSLLNFFIGLLFFLNIFAIVNFIIGMHVIRTLEKEENYNIELDETQKTMKLVDSNRIMMPLVFFNNPKFYLFSLCDISKVELRKLANTDARVLVFFFKNTKKELRLSNKKVEEADFYELINALKRNHINVID